jgi:hypothetical protein
MDNIKIIKLHNGIDLIANVSMNNDHYLLEEPMEFDLEYRQASPGLIMRHWLPVQLLKQNEIEIKNEDVLSVLEPNVDFCEYYLNTVEKIKDLLKAKNLMESIDEDDMQNIMSEFKDLRNNGDTLH